MVYRNIVKALPWMEEVREKLEDPAYWGWFLHYKPELRNGTTAGGNLYHDHLQTPGWPGGGGSDSPTFPDGFCPDSPGGRPVAHPPGNCSCGKGIPCGEYLFDHRNASLTTWLTEQYINGPKYGLGNVAVDGFYLDDDWAHNAPSEEAGSWKQETGLSSVDIAGIKAGWQKNMAACQQSIIDHGGWNWQLFGGGGGGHGGSPVSAPGKKQCAAFFRGACTTDSLMQTNAMFFSMSVNGKSKAHTPWTLDHEDLDLATFLLARGPFAWLGYGWSGCGCGWSMDGKMTCGGYPRPETFDADYGEPAGLCTEAGGVFTREWTHATVVMDCNAYRANITTK